MCRRYSQETKIHPQSYVSRTHAYMINKDSTNKLLAISARDTSRALDGIFGHAIRDKAIVAYIAKDKIVTFNDALVSDIDSRAP